MLPVDTIELMLGSTKLISPEPVMDSASPAAVRSNVLSVVTEAFADVMDWGVVVVPVHR